MQANTLLVLLLVGCSPAVLPPPCDEASAAKLAAECAALAANCVAEGKAEEVCGAICDERADERQKACEK